MVIHVREIAGAADTAEQGAALREKLQSELANSDKLAVISFDGIKTATSSFVNASFVALLTEMSLDDIKRRLRVIESTRQINEMIKSRLERSSTASAA